jgi:hypothetical protein
LRCSGDRDRVLAGRRAAQKVLADHRNLRSCCACTDWRYVCWTLIAEFDREGAQLVNDRGSDLGASSPMPFGESAEALGESTKGQSQVLAVSRHDDVALENQQ